MEMQLARKNLTSFTSPTPSSNYPSTIAPNKSEYSPSISSSYDLCSIGPHMSLSPSPKNFEFMTTSFDLGGDEWVIIRKEDIEIMRTTKTYVMTTNNEKGWKGCGIGCTGQADCWGCGEDALELKKEWGMRGPTYAAVAKKGGKEEKPKTLEERRASLETRLGCRI